MSREELGQFDVETEIVWRLMTPALDHANVWDGVKSGVDLHFSYVEVNATLYAIPNIRMVERWCHETPDDFRFDIKLPKLLSRHAMPAKFLPPNLRSKLPVKGVNVELNTKSEQLVIERLLQELRPLFDAKKFGAFL